jgi:hypothetical protein
MGCRHSLTLTTEDSDAVTTPNPSHRGTEPDYVPARKPTRAHIAALREGFADTEKAMDRAELGSLKTIQRRRLLNEIVHAYTGPNGEGFALVLDRLGTYLISTQLNMGDIMFPTAGVCLVENLFKKRQPNPYMSAVYFVQPTANNFRAIIRDFQEKGPAMYAGVHILLTSTVPPAGLELLKSAPRLRRHLLSVNELHCELFPMEDCLCSFGVPESLNLTFGEGIASDRNKSRVQADHYELVASRLLGACISLHEVPHVRIASGNARCRRIYDVFAQKLTAFVQENPAWWFHSSGDAHNGIGQRATLLIVDRCDDLAAPLVHEFSYQAMLHDTLEKDIKAGLGQTTFEYSAVCRGEHIDMSLSNSADEIWSRYRHTHVVGLAEALSKWYKWFAQTEEFQLLEQMKGSAGAGGGGGRPTKTRQLMKLLRTKDTTGKRLKFYKQHQTVAQLLFNDLRSRNGVDELLLDISELEAEIITGVEVVSDSGTAREISESKILTNLCAGLSRPEFQPSDKLRLVLLWFITFGGTTSQAKAQQIFDSCDPELPIFMTQTIPRLAWLGVAINNNSGGGGGGGRKAKENAKRRAVARKRVHVEALKREKTNTLRTRQLTTRLEDTIGRHLDGTLDSTTEYEWFDPFGPPAPPPEFATEGDMDNAPAWYHGIGQSGAHASPGSSSSSGSGAGSSVAAAVAAASGPAEGGRSLRRHRLQMSTGNASDAHGGGVAAAAGGGLRFGQGATLKFGGNKNSGAQQRRKSERKVNSSVAAATATASSVDGGLESQGVALSGARTLVLMVGGTTFGESKGVHTLMKERGREIVMLTTGFLTPLAFCEQIRKMGKDEDDGGGNSSSSSTDDEGDDKEEE